MENEVSPTTDQSRANKIFFAIFFGLIAVVVLITFCKFFIFKSYYIQAEGDCDPYTEKCFVWECDPEATEEEEKCTGEAEKDVWYYKKVRKIADEVSPCDPNDENCDALICDSDMDCEVSYCDESAVEEGEICNDPVKYTEENPVEEEECAEDDEECLESAEEETEECAPDDEECLNAEESEDNEDSEEIDDSDVGDKEEEGGSGSNEPEAEKVL